MGKSGIYGSKWSHDETVLALGLYFQIPFGNISSRHPDIIELAEMMQRSPASLSMKMGNIGRFDPNLAAKGISGLSNGARMERSVWFEFENDRAGLFKKYSELRSALEKKNVSKGSISKVECR